MIQLLKFDPKRVSVSFAEDTCRTVAPPNLERRYTLTHNDLTRHLTLSVASDFNGRQTEIWYTQLLRDEVLAEWREDGLHVHCNVSVEGHWWISWAKPLRALVFRQKLPLVLDTLRYAERDLLMTYPQLLKAPVFVNFHGEGNGEGRVVGVVGGDGETVEKPGVQECWGPLRDAGSRGRGERVDEGGEEAFSRARDLWAVTGGSSRAAATVELDAADKSQSRTGGGGGSGGGSGSGGGGVMGAAGLAELGTSRARSFAKNGVGVPSSSAGVEDVNTLGSAKVIVR